MAVIKRYANRKLYDTDAKRYITLDGIADLIRAGEDVQVIDHETGNDLTPLITAQIVLAQEKKVSGSMPHNILTDLIQAGSDTLNHLRQTFVPRAELNGEVEAEIERRVKTLVENGGLTQDEAARLLPKLLKPGRHPKGRRATGARGQHPPETGAAIKRALKKHNVPTQAELERLAKQVAKLNAELDSLKTK